MRVGYLGPEGTFSHEALLAATDGQGTGIEPVPLATNHDVVLAVQDGRVERALAPIENSLEGGVSQTLDALAFAAPDVVVTGEAVHAVHHCLLAPLSSTMDDVLEVRSHPQPLAQCARWLREHLPAARPVAVASTAEAVRGLPREGGVAAIGTRAAGERYGARVLAERIEDEPDNATRFWWLAPAGTPVPGTPSRTSLLFHGAGDASPGWLVRCLSEFAFRGVNLTRIESRPLRSQLGHYLFQVDGEGGVGEPAVDEAIAALRTHCESVRVLGSYSRGASAPAPARLPAGHGGNSAT
jgi:prephenate dehydratase